jgi:beta-glucosidase
MNNRARIFDGLEVPANFVLGVATSAWQIEGDLAGRGACNWDEFANIPGKVVDGATGEPACDHVNRIEEDLDLLAWLGVDTYRFSISWARVIPGGVGPISAAGIDFYDRLVNGLIDRGIAPVPTLFHWDTPLAIEHNGGWTNRETAHQFADYARAMASHFGSKIQQWATLNEPWCSAFLGYCAGYFAPGRMEPKASLEAAYNLILGHGLAVNAMREVGANNIGIVLNVIPCVAETPEMESATEHIDGMQNRLFLDLLAGKGVSDLTRDSCASITDWAFVRDSDNVVLSTPIDWVGENYYTINRIAAPGVSDIVAIGQDTSMFPACPPANFAPRGERTDMGWEIFPEGLLMALRQINESLPDIPLWVCENGMAAPDSIDDPERIAYLRAHIAQAIAAREEGLDVRGYFAWSLMDNLEWASGWTKKFGLIRVDPATGEREPKASARWYRELLARR